MQMEGTILTPEGWRSGRLLIDRGLIAAIEYEHEGEAIESGGAPRLIPGFIDLHVHGGGGADLMEGGEALAVMARTHARFGTTSLLGTSMTASRVHLEAALGDAGRVMKNPPEDGAALLGIHLEGPFISPERLGAQPAFARPGTLEEFKALNALAPIRVVTLAPEIEGHPALIEALSRLGVRVQIGHSDADYATALSALERGAAGFTHLFNAMSGFHHREAGVLGAALAHAEYAELIADLIHVEAGALLAARRAIPSLYAVTDATAAAGMPEGAYRLGEHRVFRRGESVRLADGSLAGSALTMDRAFRHLIELGLSAAEASARLSTLPARYLGLDDRGALSPGLRADVVCLDAEHRVTQVVIGGRSVVN